MYQPSKAQIEAAAAEIDKAAFDYDQVAIYLAGGASAKLWEEKRDKARMIAKHALIAAATVKTHHHIKRDSDYSMIGIGKMQAEDWYTKISWGLETADSVDMAVVAVYRDVNDGSLWVRPKGEFEDGRFEPVGASEPAVTSVPKPQRSGWPKPGDKMKFLNKNGYDSDRADAIKYMAEDDIVTVQDIHIGGFYHSIQFEEFPGRWFNGVMFEWV